MEFTHMLKTWTLVAAMIALSCALIVLMGGNMAAVALGAPVLSLVLLVLRATLWRSMFRRSLRR